MCAAERPASSRQPERQPRRCWQIREDKGHTSKQAVEQESARILFGWNRPAAQPAPDVPRITPRCDSGPCRTMACRHETGVAYRRVRAIRAIPDPGEELPQNTAHLAPWNRCARVAPRRVRRGPRWARRQASAISFPGCGWPKKSWNCCNRQDAKHSRPSENLDDSYGRGSSPGD